MNETGKIADNDHLVMVHGEGILCSAVATHFVDRGAKVAVSGTVDGCESLTATDDAEMLLEAKEKLGGLTILVNVCLPIPGDSIGNVLEYPERLRQRCEAAAELLVEADGSPAIINHCALPAMYLGTELEDYMATLRGGVTGVTRTYARKFGKQGLRVSAVQTGLVELYDDSWISQRVKDVAVPTKRWTSMEEVAKFIGFLAVESTYTTGQTMIMDGGLTAGISGV